MRGLWSSLALIAWGAISNTVSATPEPSIDLVERQSTSTNASTWIYTGDNGDNGSNLTFTITVNPANNDMWFRMSGPTVYSWIGIGAGSEMSKAKAFFIAYQGSKDDNLIISARGACDDCEPAYIKGFGLNSAVTTDKDPAPFGIRNDTYFVSGFVANGTKKAGIDPNAKNQPFMFAVGPTGHAPRSDAFDAPLRMHSLHGTFQLDMTKAQGIKLPALGTKEVGVAFQGRATRDREVGSPAHAAILGFAFVIVLPIGILMLRLLNKVKLHMIVQGIGLLFITVGWVIGLVISKRYQRSMDFKSPHQIIGIIVYILLLAQWATGFFHHRVYLRTQQPTWMIKPHKYGLGGLVLGLGIVNVAVGFRFANAGAYNMFYVPIVVAVIIVMIMSVTLKKFLGSRRAKASVPFGGPVPNYQAPYGSQVQGQAPGYGGPLAPGAPGGAAGTTWGQRSDIELGKMGPPPSYSNEPTKPREML